MPIRDALLPEFDQEMANTRKTLERVPEDKFDWKPHPKSFSMVALATHVSRLPGWGSMTIAQDSLDIAPPGEPPPRAEAAKSRAELLEKFDDEVRKTREALSSVSDEVLMGKWTLLSGGKEVFSIPRVAVLRSFVMNHLIHHRAQLGVYLRLNDIPVPAMYGPSADEGAF
ncbi:MAG TPA: DinB family protein [Blastocatellia bacterium]|nr:DinB family protein [Blastocatellia bacterium]